MNILYAWQKTYEVQNRLLPDIRKYGDFDFYLIQNQEENLLFVGGVQEKTDLLTAANVDFLEFGNGGILEGVYGAFSECSELLDLLRDKPTSIAGFSFGGAIAVVLGRELLLSGGKINQIFTFGSPRAFDKKGAMFYDALLKYRTYRFYLPRDPVCHLPIARAWHVGMPCAMEDEVTTGSDRWAKLVADLFYDSRIARAFNWLSVGLGGALYASGLLKRMAAYHDIQNYDDWFEVAKNYE